jgi:CXXC-20-CXXC protein
MFKGEMFMKICKQCFKKIGWLRVLKGIWGVSQTITCNNCKKEYSITLFSKVILFFLTIVLPTFVSINIMGSKLSHRSYGFISFLITGIVFVFLSPYYIKLKDK